MSPMDIPLKPLFRSVSTTVATNGALVLVSHNTLYIIQIYIGGQYCGLAGYSNQVFCYFLYLLYCIVLAHCAESVTDTVNNVHRKYDC